MADRSVVSALTRDHRRIEELLTRLQSATDAVDRRTLLDEVTTEIVQHADAEEKYLYEVVRGAIPYGAVDIEKQIEAHAKIKTVLGELQRTDAGREEFDRLISELSAEVHQNISNEENSVFAWLTQWVDERTLAELGDEIEALRS